MNSNERALRGLRVVVTRPLAQAPSFAAQLEEAGAQPIAIPAIRVEFHKHASDLIAALRELHSVDWVVFTSANGVEAAVRACVEDGIPLDRLSEKQLAVVGSGTAQALARFIRPPDAVPEKFLTTEVPTALGEVGGKRVLLARADIAEKELPKLLRAKGAIVTEVVAYSVVENEDLELVALIKSLGELPDVVTFTSPSTVRGFMRLLKAAGREAWMKESTLACIGPVTERELRKFGFAPHIVADEYSGAGLVDGLVAWRRKDGKSNTTSV